MKRWLAVGLVMACCAVLSVKVMSSAASHDDAFTRDGLLTAQAEQLKTTTVAPHMDWPIQPGRSVIWCGTFQLVWNEVCGLLGEDVHFAPDPPMVAVMNKKAFTATDLDDASYVALAGFVRDGIRPKIAAALKDKFKGQASPHFLPNPAAAPRPQDIVGYAYLFKNLEFATPFERLDQVLPFEGTNVAAFGMGPGNKPGHAAMCPQVSILDYKGRDDFIVELKTKAAGDRLILAKVSPAATLRETVDAVVLRIAAARPVAATPGDVLAVPKFNFDITRTFGEIMYSLLVVKNPAVAKDLTVQEAAQDIRFQMDEKGVRLQSESHMSFGCGAERPPTPAHIMIFNKPFLVLMKRADGSLPYFAMWVGDAELLAPVDGEDRGPLME